MTRATSREIAIMVGTKQALGSWLPGATRPDFTSAGLVKASVDCREQVHIIGNRTTGGIGVAFDGSISPRRVEDGEPYVLLASLPPVYPEWLGDPGFLQAHGVRFPYVAGAMAHGIASPQLVISMARAGMLGFFGAAGLELDAIEAGVMAIGEALRDTPSNWGANLIHTPRDQSLEESVVELYLRRRVRRVSASAYLTLTPGVVRLACSGLRVSADGHIQRQHRVFAKVSRPEVAAQFMSPPPADMLGHLVAQDRITRLEAELASRLPVSEDITAESDSGGHTDNQPLTSLLPGLCSLRDQLMARFQYRSPIRIGAAGGIGTPAAVSGAFQLGAAYVLTGSVNQCSVESGMSLSGKQMLARAGPTDVMMAPSPDMFEMGNRVQVLKRGSLFGVRARRLYELYRSHASLEDIPAETRQRLEREVFQMSVEDVWEQTRAYVRQRHPHEIDRAEEHPKHRMALVFRWYLGKSARWATAGDPERILDYQLWCGPAMGAFNTWVRGSFLETLENRSVTQIARNLLEGAAVITRAHQLRSLGLPVPHAAFAFTPRRLHS